MMKLEDIETRLAEMPDMIKRLQTEQNQLVGYRQAMIDAIEAEKEQAKEDKKSKKPS